MTFQTAVYVDGEELSTILMLHYYVWNPQGAPPKVPHDAIVDAEREQNRLSNKFPGQRFFVIGVDSTLSLFDRDMLFSNPVPRTPITGERIMSSINVNKASQTVVYVDGKELSTISKPGALLMLRSNNGKREDLLIQNENLNSKYIKTLISEIDEAQKLLVEHLDK